MDLNVPFRRSNFPERGEHEVEADGALEFGNDNDLIPGKDFVELCAVLFKICAV